VRALGLLERAWARLGSTERGAELRALLVISLPVMIQSMLGQLLNIVDLVFVGTVLGPQFLAAAALGNTAFMLWSALYMGAAAAVDDACSEAFERGRFAHVGVLGQRGLFVMLACAALTLGGLSGTAQLLSGAFGQDRALSATAGGFVQALSMGLLPHVASIGLSRVLWAQGLVWAPIAVDLASNVVNVSLNAALIEVDGFLGAPLATSLARCLQLLMIVGYVVRYKPHAAKGTWGGWQLRAALGDAAGLAAMARAALLGAAVCAAESWPLELSHLVAGRIDVPSLDAHTVLLNSCLFIGLGPPLGFSVAAAARIPAQLDEGDAAAARRTAQVAVAAVACYNAACALLLLAGRWSMGALFTSSAEVAAQCAAAAGLAALFSLLDGLQSVLGGVLRGLGRGRAVTALYFAGTALVGLPAGAFLAVTAGHGTPGLWLGQCCGAAAVAVAFAALLSTVDLEAEAAARRAARDRARAAEAAEARGAAAAAAAGAGAGVGAGRGADREDGDEDAGEGSALV